MAGSSADWLMMVSYTALAAHGTADIAPPPLDHARGKAGFAQARSGIGRDLDLRTDNARQTYVTGNTQHSHVIPEIGLNHRSILNQQITAPGCSFISP